VASQWDGALQRGQRRSSRDGSGGWSVSYDRQQVGDVGHIKVFANVDPSERWFEENDLEGVAFEYDVIEE
jgi:hypothetical protein